MLTINGQEINPYNEDEGGMLNEDDLSLSCPQHVIISKKNSTVVILPLEDADIEMLSQVLKNIDLQGFIDKKCRIVIESIAPLNKKMS